MTTRKKILLLSMSVLLFCGAKPRVVAQDNAPQEKIQCFIVGFDFGTVFPSKQASTVSLAGGGNSKNATMNSLYKSPWLNFGLNGFYKWRSNWLASIEGDFWFGNDNLRHRTERMSDIYTSEGIIIGTNGTDAVVTAYNRALALRGGVGKIITLAPTKNPNSGLLTRLSAGWMQQQTIFTLNEEQAPQIDGDNALLYDHQRRGFMLTESVGYWFMSNHANLFNFYVAFELSEVWSHSTRDFVVDNYLDLHGKDDNNYFDLLYTIKLCWMFPLKGKTAREYYYF